MLKYFGIILVSLFCIYSLFLVSFSNVGFPDSMSTDKLFPYLADKPISEDAYYVLSISWNLGRGEGFDYNYHQHSTGVQPLITLMYGILAFISNQLNFNKWGFLRVVLIFNLLLVPIFYFCLKKLLKRIITLDESSKILLIVLCFFNNEIFRLFSFGLETGLYLILFTLLISYSIDFFNKTQKTINIIYFGLMTGIVILTRIDFLIVIFVFVLISVYKKRLSFKSVVIFSLACLMIIFPWFLYVYKITGTIIPSSGGAQAKVISANDFLLRLNDMFVAILTHLTPWIYSGGIFKVLLVGVFISFIVLVYKKFEILNFYKNANNNIRFLSEWFVSILPLVLVYFLFFWASHFYIRYTSLLLIFILPAIMLILNNKLKSDRVMMFFSISMVSLFFAQNIYAFHLGRVSNNHLISAGYINQHYSSSVKVGAFQSGVIGYLNENVINLDGKVNMDALAHIKNNNLDEYLDKSGIKVMIDWESCIQNYLSPDYLNQNWVEVQRLKNALGKEVSICLERK